MNLEKLEAKIEEYLETLPNGCEDEYYCSSRQFAEGELYPFLEWLKANN
jgi:hypothetical protein